jgi:hypothetical protein
MILLPAVMLLLSFSNTRTSYVSWLIQPFDQSNVIWHNTYQTRHVVCLFVCVVVRVCVRDSRNIASGSKLRLYPI